MHLKGLLNINLVVLVVILLLDGVDFLYMKRMFLCLFLACHWRRSALVLQISFQTGVRRWPLSGGALSYVDHP
jgi:hypothetical protein